MLAIIGCGNLNRCDDGVGVVIARRLEEFVHRGRYPGVSVYDAGTDGMGVMFRARGATSLVVIDASRSGSEAGAIFKVPGSELARDYQPSYSLHDFRWDHALQAGRRIFGSEFPSDITVYLIEAARLDLGCELSAAVAAAPARVSGEIEQLIERHARAAVA